MNSLKMDANFMAPRGFAVGGGRDFRPHRLRRHSHCHVRSQSSRVQHPEGYGERRRVGGRSAGRLLARRVAECRAAPAGRGGPQPHHRGEGRRAGKCAAEEVAQVGRFRCQRGADRTPDRFVRDQRASLRAAQRRAVAGRSTRHAGARARRVDRPHPHHHAQQFRSAVDYGHEQYRAGSPRQ